MAKTISDIYRKTGILGISDEQINEHSYRAWGQALGDLLPVNSRFVVSSDCRPSSEAYKQTLIEGLVEQGTCVIDIGKCPTNLAFFARDSVDAVGFAAVTGGSRGPTWNGLRWQLNDLSRSFAQQVEHLRNWRLSDQQDSFLSFGKAGSCRVWDPTYEWVSWLQEIWFDTPSVPIKVILDPMYGNWAELASLALRAIFSGFEIIAIHDQPRSDIENWSPGVQAIYGLHSLKLEVLSQKADLGIALEPDAERFFLVDDQGEPLSNDEICWLFLQMLGPSLKDEFFLHTPRCSVKNIAEGERYGGKAMLVSAEEEPFLAEMKRTEALIGFGDGGEIYYRGVRGNRIVFFAICWILDYLAHLRCPLSLWRTQFPEGFFR